MNKREDIYNQAIQKFGKELQLDVAIEEMAELTKELIKDIRGKGNRENILEEIADVHIMLEQLRIIYDFGPTSLEYYIRCKVNRLESVLEGETE